MLKVTWIRIATKISQLNYQTVTTTVYNIKLLTTKNMNQDD